MVRDSPLIKGYSVIHTERNLTNAPEVVSGKPFHVGLGEAVWCGG